MIIIGITYTEKAEAGKAIIEACEEMLANTKTQLENAKLKVEKPFMKEDELKTKSARLDELNILQYESKGYRAYRRRA